MRLGQGQSKVTQQYTHIR